MLKLCFIDMDTYDAYVVEIIEQHFSNWFTENTDFYPNDVAPHIIYPIELLDFYIHCLEHSYNHKANDGAERADFEYVLSKVRKGIELYSSRDYEVRLFRV